ncbi:MAG: DUF6249 domain-containing protein [Sphingobacteriaceae bacterium]
MEGILVPILISLGAFAMVFGLRYLANRERMAMIQQGLDPQLNRPQSAPYRNLKWGLLLMGAGIGLFLAFYLDHTVFSANLAKDDDANVPVYFALVGIFGGLGLFVSYLIEKKEAGAK